MGSVVVAVVAREELAIAGPATMSLAAAGQAGLYQHSPFLLPLLAMARLSGALDSVTSHTIKFPDLPVV